MIVLTEDQFKIVADILLQIEFREIIMENGEIFSIKF